MTPFPGGIVPDAHGHYPAYAGGKNAWRCSMCGKVSPWVDGWGVYCSVRDQEEGHGLLANARPGGWPVSCSSNCYARLLASGAMSEGGHGVNVNRPKGKP